MPTLGSQSGRNNGLRSSFSSSSTTKSDRWFDRDVSLFSILPLSDKENINILFYIIFLAYFSFDSEKGTEVNEVEATSCIFIYYLIGIQQH